MQFYKVGGAVRDKILGRQRRDLDFVVLGATPEQMTSAGYRPVGRDFPVFTHPQRVGHQYALARTERKSGVGHQGFVFYADPDVTLEQDLLRRDFTVNAMAEDESGALIDPYGGRRDISRRVLRHVSAAFSEDPLRVLRALRYSAELGFAIAPETHRLICEIVARGELAELSAERIWLELMRGLASPRPHELVAAMRGCGALAFLLPEVDALFGVPQNPRSHPEGCAGLHTQEVLFAAAANWWPLEVRFASLLHDVGKALTPADKLPDHPQHEQAGVPLVKRACARLKVPAALAQAAQAVVAEHGNIHKFGELDAGAACDLFSRVGAWRGPGVLDCLLAVADCDHAAHPQVSVYALHPQRKLVRRAYQAGAQADAAAAAQARPDSAKEAVRAARVAAIAQVLHAAY